MEREQDRELLEKERDYYKRMAADLGARVHRMAEENGVMRRSADRSRTTASLLKKTYDLAATELTMEALPHQFVRLLATTIRADAAALYRVGGERSSFVQIAATGLADSVGMTLCFADAPPSFSFWAQGSVEPEAAQYLQESTGMQHVLWVCSPEHGLGLLLANSATVGQELAFCAEDREVAEGALHVYFDIHTRKKAALELEQANLQLEASMEDLTVALDRAHESSRLKSEFVASLSHELRTPLNIIVNVPELLLQAYRDGKVWRCLYCKEDFESDEPIVDGGPLELCPECGAVLEVADSTVFLGNAHEHAVFLRRLHKSASHLRRLVDDLLDFSKLEANRMKLQVAQVDLAPFFCDLRETFEGVAAEHALSISYPALAPGQLVVEADGVKLSQVFINLLSNAVRHTPPGGRVSIHAERTVADSLESVVFSVSDTGEGIPLNALESIFESFRQVDGSHTRRHGGTGLGLAITKHLVELHGGSIWAESELGKGSVFNVVLPLDGSRVAPIEDDWTTGARRVLHRIVIVIDDDRTQLTLVDTVLRRSGYVTELVLDPKEAMQRIVALRPACVLLDVMMPEVSGIQILKELRSHPELSQTPVVVISAYHANEMVVKRYHAQWLPKPWDSRRLLEVIDGLVDHV